MPFEISPSYHLGRINKHSLCVYLHSSASYSKRRITGSHIKVFEVLHAVEFLETNGISAELINLRSIKPIDWEMIFSSVHKTGRLLALDTGPESGSIAGEIISRVSTNCFEALKQAPRRLTLPDIPTPTSLALTKVFYKRAEDIGDVVGSMLGKDLDTSALQLQRKFLHDVPGDWFKGPF